MRSQTILNLAQTLWVEQPCCTWIGTCASFKQYALDCQNLAYFTAIPPSYNGLRNVNL